ncbi:multisubstrate pseudouridine synthase 7 [Knufia fluminis]|uniref:Multisubstrate pseudouridine synthase 7 n=1 Tax=Knufia fluminis TaxID=191047 RepID=A0AAN8E8S7_9EURO|nr:multisubstrate pseudouridine synthase 7 [Knufia fluminis]
MTLQPENDGGLEPPTKRRRLSIDPTGTSRDRVDPSVSNMTMLTPEQKKEFEVGIQAYVEPHAKPFEGILKQRYSDFLVNEILPNGQVVHLRSTRAPRLKQSRVNNDSATPTQPQVDENDTNQASEPADVPPQQTGNGGNAEQKVQELPDVAEDDRTKLVENLNENAVADLLKLYQSIRGNPSKKAHEHPVVRTEFTTDRSIRSQIHQRIREVFNSTIESSTDHDGVLVLKAANSNSRGKQQGNSWNRPQNKNQRPGKLGWLDRGGEYLHFTVYKENKDTMEVISWLTRNLKCNAKNFQFAGTKDRRAVTTQRCSAYRIEAERLEAQNRTLRGSKVGDFEYHQQGLELGDLSGNEFVITLRDCKHSGEGNAGLDLHAFKQSLLQGMRSLRDNGYINYYGQQRFGTFSTRTDVIGRHILQENYQAACDAILSFQQDALDAAQQQDSTTQIGQDDKNRALAIHTWRKDHTLNAALDILPRKFSAEAQLMRHLTKQPSDYLGALMTIQRNLRLMYVHAHQSYIWNMAATNRMKVLGSEVAKGDLVLVSEHKEKDNSSNGADDNGAMAVDADGEQIIEPAGHDRAAQEDDVFERARALTEEEVNSGKYSIFDIVLPQPGYDILYPDNESGEFYKTFMSTPEGGELDPYSMRRKHREFSLSGSYRKVLARIGEDFDVEVHSYAKDDEQFVKTDVDLMHGARRGDEANEAEGNAAERGPDEKSEGDKVAAVLKFQLGASQYATMALRQLSRGGIAQYKPDFSGGR